MSLLRAWRFFRANAGGVVGECALGALRLARAEAEAQERNMEFEWEFDEGGDLGDHEYWCRKDCGKEHEILWCAAYDADGRDGRRRPLASLGGIIDPSNDYRRVIEAELALEALGTLDGNAVAIAG